jgi:hypothetical protein
MVIIGAIEDHDVTMWGGWVYCILGPPGIICCVVYAHDVVTIYAVRLEEY